MKAFIAPPPSPGYCEKKIEGMVRSRDMDARISCQGQPMNALRMNTTPT
jgi:hypothetical protein